MSRRPEIVIAADPAAMAEKAAARVASVVHEAVDARGRCSLCLAGGGTPKAVYELMARNDALPWSKMDFYFGDERCVPPDDEDSNYLMASGSLLGPRGIAEGQIKRMKGEDPDREAAADAYAALLPEAIDVLLLGMGPDGHTASLFPGHEAMGETTRRVVPVKGPKPPPWRLTITAPVIEAARHTFVLAHGAGKASMINRAINGDYDPSDCPIQCGLEGGVWFLDEAAAAELD